MSQVKIDLDSIPSFIYLRKHLATGHAYMECFTPVNTRGLFVSEELADHVPSRATSRVLDTVIARWNAEGKDVWCFERLSLGAALRFQEHGNPQGASV